MIHFLLPGFLHLVQLVILVLYMKASAAAQALTPSPIHYLHHHRRFNPNPCSASMPRPPNRRRRNRRRATDHPTTTTTIPADNKPSFYTSSDADNFQATFDLNSLYLSSHCRFRRLISSAAEAVEDLQTLVSLDPHNRVVLSCRPSTLRFVGNFALFSCALVVGLRVMVGLLMLGFRSGSGYAPEKVITRRDRSLGGKEVVVRKLDTMPRPPQVNVKKRSLGILDNPDTSFVPGMEETVLNNRVRFANRLPQWWPAMVSQQYSTAIDNEDHQREANRLVRAITDVRMSGKDIMETDIIHLRQICRTYGVRVTFDTTNTRDSLYRVSVDFVLNVCSRALNNSTTVEIDGEDAQQFIAGLADNIGLDNVRAARIVTAAVAARTRSCFLQAWALVMQGKHAEAGVELSKICLVWRIFPPEESSPEMEMVARGLEKHLKMDQREFLMSMLVGICSEESQRRAAEALGLTSSFNGVGEQ